MKLKHGRDLWPVKVDISQIEQVIVNLAVNARDAMPNGGKFTILTRNVGASGAVEKFGYEELPRANYLLVELTDTGVGIPSNVADKIFEPFFTTKEAGKGSGLGLSTVYGIVKQSEGFIFLDTLYDKGTRFRIFLPRSFDQAESTETGE